MPHLGGPSDLQVMYLAGAFQHLTPLENLIVQLYCPLPLHLLLGDVDGGDTQTGGLGHSGHSVHHLPAGHHLLPHLPLQGTSHTIHGSFAMTSGKEVIGDGDVPVHLQQLEVRVREG